jgi:hypothetical protein
VVPLFAALSPGSAIATEIARTERTERPARTGRPPFVRERS